jgi:hypothetical protein
MRGYAAKTERRTSDRAEQRNEAHAGRAGADARVDTDAQPVNASSKTASLLQLRAALDQSPSVRSQVALQRALDQRWSGPAGAASHIAQQEQHDAKPALQMKGVAILDDAPVAAPGLQSRALPGSFGGTVQLVRKKLNPKQAANRDRWMTRHAQRNVRETERMKAEAKRNVVAPENASGAPPTATGAGQASASLPLQNVSEVKQGDTDPLALALAHGNINYIASTSSNNNTTPVNIGAQRVVHPESEVKSREVKQPDKDNITAPTNMGSQSAAGFSLHDVKSKQDTSGWRGDHPELASAHHKYPKSALVALHEQMTQEQQAELGKKLHLDPRAGAMAMTRLRSNLISPKYQGLTVATSDKRLDDAHNNRDEAKEGEEGLDLVRQTDGNLTPRSKQYHALKNVTARIYARRSEAPDKAKFKLDDKEAADVTEHLLAAEQLHYAIEKDPKQASHAADQDVWEAVGNQNVKYRKHAVPPIKVDPAAAAKDYDAKKGDEVKQELAERYRKLAAEREEKEAEERRQIELHKAKKAKEEADKDKQREASRRTFFGGHSSHW